MAAKAATHDLHLQTRSRTQNRVCRGLSWMAAFAAMTEVGSRYRATPT